MMVLKLPLGLTWQHFLNLKETGLKQCSVMIVCVNKQTHKVLRQELLPAS